MPLAGFLGALRPAAQALGGVGSILSAVRYTHSRLNPRTYHTVRTTSSMPNYRRKRKRYGRRRRGRTSFRRKGATRPRYRRGISRFRRARRLKRFRPGRGRRLLERKLLRRARGGGRFSGTATRRTMTILTYEEKKYVNQNIDKGKASKDFDLKVQKMDWFAGAWLPDPKEVNPIKLGIFVNYRYTRCGKIIFTLRNFDEINMFKFDDDAKGYFVSLFHFRCRFISPTMKYTASEKCSKKKKSTRDFYFKSHLWYKWII